MVKFLHCADIHLGFSAYDKHAENGVNAREMDVYNAWLEFFKYASAHPPDFIVVAGDLFDSNNPTPQAYVSASLLRLLKIPIVVIMGNHEKASAGNFSPINVLQSYDYIARETPGIVEVCGVKIFCAPYTGEIYTLEPADVLLAHGAIDGPEEYKFVTNKLSIKADQYKYCALGDLHYHYVRGTMFYPGSLIPLTFNQAGKTCGFLEVDLNTGNITHHKVSSRRLVTLDLGDPETLANMMPEDIQGAIVRVITDATDVSDIRKALEPLAFHLKFVRRKVDQEASVISVEGKTIRDEYVDFSKKSNKEHLIQPGLQYLGG